MDYGSLRSVPAVLCLAFMLPGMLGCAGVCAALCPIGWCPVSTWTMCARGVSGIVGGMESMMALNVTADGVTLPAWQCVAMILILVGIVFIVARSDG